MEIFSEFSNVPVSASRTVLRIYLCFLGLNRFISVAKKRKRREGKEWREGERLDRWEIRKCVASTMFWLSLYRVPLNTSNNGINFWRSQPPASTIFQNEIPAMDDQNHRKHEQLQKLVHFQYLVSVFDNIAEDA